MRRAHQSAAASPPEAPPSRPLPRDPDVTGTFPPPPPSAARAEPGPARRARAASCPAQPGGRVRALRAARDAPPAPERAPLRASQARGPPPAPQPPAPPPQSPPSAPGTARRVAEPESSRPPHCTTRLPNCLHRPACECVCVYSVSHREAEEVEEKEKEECAGRDRRGAHTHSHSVTLSERVAPARTRPQSRSARRTPGRRGKVAPALIAPGRALAPRLCAARGILCSWPGTPGTQAAAASGTVGSLGNNSGGRPLRGGPKSAAAGVRGPEPASAPRPLSQRGLRVCTRQRRAATPAVAPVGAEPSPLCKLHPAGWKKSRRPRRARSAFLRGSGDLQSRDRPGRGRDAGRSRALFHERRLATPGPGPAAPGRSGHPDQTAAGCGRRGGGGGGGGQVPATLRVPKPPGLPQPPRLAVQPAAPARRAGSRRQLRERAGAQPHRGLPATAPSRARACVPGAVHPHRPRAALQGVSH
nr:tribbles homolog 1 isoform X1 [Oryctolagus cuniculus]